MSPNTKKAAGKKRKSVPGLKKKASKETWVRELNMEARKTIEKNGGNSDDITFSPMPEGEMKMSWVILKLIKPYFLTCKGMESRLRMLIDLAVVAWNMGFLSREEQTMLQGKWIDTFPVSLDAQDVASLFYMFETLLERQKTMFPDIKNIILAHIVRFRDGQLFLEVSSAPFKERKKGLSISG